MRIVVATPEDAEEIVALVHRAFAPVAEEYGIDTLPPLADTAAQMRSLPPGSVVLKAVRDGRIVGSVRGVPRGGTIEVGRLVVDPGEQGCGIGAALTEALEAAFPDAERFELFTGHRPGPALHLYRRLGYRPFRTERASDAVSLIFLEKPGPGGR